jgi:hypothetical protein
MYEWRINDMAVSTVSNLSYFTTSSLSSLDKVTVMMTSNDPCAPTTAVASNLIYTSVSNGINPGTIGSDQTICYNTVPMPITQITAPANIVGTPTYTWEVSTINSGAWVTIPGATNATYTPIIPLTHDVYIRRITTDPGTPAPCNMAPSNTVHITIRPQLVAGLIFGDEMLCANSSSSTITNISLPTGGQGGSVYVWESSLTNNPATFSPVTPAATATTHNPGTLTVTTYFRRREVNTCGTVYSNVVTKTISAPEVVTAVIDNAPSQACVTAQIVFTANGSSTTGTGTLNYQWYLGPVVPANAVGTNSSTYTYLPNANDNGIVLTVVVTTSAACNAGTSSASYTLDIVSSVTPTVTISSNATHCAGLQTTFTATSTGAGAVPFYQWYVIPSGGSSPGNAVGIGGTTYSSSTLSNGDRVYVEMTSSLACLAASNPFKSNEITMIIKPIPAPVINESSQTICAPQIFTYHATVGTGTSLQWMFNGNPIPNGTNPTYVASQTGAYSIREDNGTCTSTSAPVQLTVVPTPIANAGPDQYVLKNSIVTLNATGGTDYSWSPSTNLSNTTIANPTFTADQTITYVVTVRNSSGTATCLSTDYVTIHVTDAPSGSFSTSILGPNPITPGQQNTVYSVVNQTGFSYDWSITGGTIVSGQNTNSVTVDWDASNAFARTTASTYSISVTETNSSQVQKTTTLDVTTLTTGVTKSLAQSGIVLFPNPTADAFYIEMPEGGVLVSYEILDITGLSVASGTFTSSTGQQKIDANFGPGIYQILLHYNNVVTCGRLSKVQ